MLGIPQKIPQFSQLGFKLSPATSILLVTCGTHGDITMFIFAYLLVVYQIDGTALFFSQVNMLQKSTFPEQSDGIPITHCQAIHVLCTTVFPHH